MTTAERRAAILQQLAHARAPIAARTLATHYGVSRQSYGHHTPGSFPLHAAMCWSSLISPPAAHGSSRCATHLTEPGRS